MIISSTVFTDVVIAIVVLSVVVSASGKVSKNQKKKVSSLTVCEEKLLYKNKLDITSIAWISVHKDHIIVIPLQVL